MKNILSKKKKKKPDPKTETIFETDYRLRQEAIKISKEFVHTKPIKFLLK